MTLVDDIANYLAAQGYGVYNDANPALNSIFIDEFQDSPANQIVIFPNGGRAPSEVMGGAPVDYPGIDIQIRNTSKATARATAEAIRQLLDASDIGIQSFFCDQSYPVYLEKDNSNRYRYAVVFSTIIERI
jgi:hypothetical protein